LIKRRVIIMLHSQEPERFEIVEEGVANLQHMVRPKQDLGSPKIFKRSMES
jgi:hypothetical protein